MIEAGILDGDLVVVQRAQDARNGEIVVALAGDDESADEATVKTFYRENGRVRLQPENASLEPIYADARADPRQGRGGLPDALMSVASVHRTLEHELFALLRGASLECPVCGEFVLHEGRRCAAPSARCSCAAGSNRPCSRYNSARRPGDRGRARQAAARGKSGHRRAGRSREGGGESRRKVAQKTDRRRRVLRRRRR